MNNLERIESVLRSIEVRSSYLDRFSHEIKFAQRLVDAKGKQEWQPLIDKALEYVESEVRKGSDDIESIVKKAEEIMSPIGKEAKEYIIYCAGHAHIDMNWMWNWPETVSVTNDTFSTVIKLMEEFPEFHFSQSQASTYMIAKQYLPELYEKIKQRVWEGRWEVTANSWVECEENLASGEILCRHFLYTKRFMREEFGFELDSVKLYWQPDLFGHPHSMPTILAKAGIENFYFCRGGKGYRLFWWESRDGSRVLAFDDGILWYNGEITPDMTRLLFDFEKATGLKEYLFIYGVGDHGGGPTRRDLMAANDMNSWPIYPTIKLSTVSEFFNSIRPKLRDDLPVVNDELNFVFPGCYTSQSNIKRANRYAENRLIESEIAAVIGYRALQMPYPNHDLMIGWRNAMFNQFHDILPGSGAHVTYEYAQGLFQETLARTAMIKTRVLRTLASMIDTTGFDGMPCGCGLGSKIGPGIGAGAGNNSDMGKVSDLSGGAVTVEPFLIFNPNPWTRTEIAVVKVWDKEIKEDVVKVACPDGKEICGQVINRGDYWGHRFVSIVFPAKDLPPVGYRVYAVDRYRTAPPATGGVTVTAPNIIESELFRIEVDRELGGIRSLFNKQLGYEFVPEGKRMAVLKWLLEEPHGMTAWEIGRIIKQTDITEVTKIETIHHGPNVATIRVQQKFNESTFTMDISLKSGVPRIDFDLNINWLERGHPGLGVPMLKLSFPVSVKAERAKFEIPCGYIERATEGNEVPALKWADITGNRFDGKGLAGITLLNESKYGHDATESELRLTLLRSSYDPDPLPELGQHNIRFAIIPHGEGWMPSDSAKAGYEFNHNIEVVATDVHQGCMPKEKSFISIKPSNIMLSGIKKAEDTDELVIRLYEIDGKDTEAVIELDPSLIRPNYVAMETDILERPIKTNTAKLDGNVLKVMVPAFSLVTVKFS